MYYLFLIYYKAPLPGVNITERTRAFYKVFCFLYRLQGLLYTNKNVWHVLEETNRIQVGGSGIMTQLTMFSFKILNPPFPTKKQMSNRGWFLKPQSNGGNIRKYKAIYMDIT